MVNELLNASYAPATLLRYHRAWDRFARFCGSAGLPCSLPVNTYTVSLFIAHLSSQKLKASTIKTLLSAISWQHKVRSLPDPTQAFLIPRLIEGIKRSQNLPPTRVNPISLSMLHRLLHALPQVTSSPFDTLAFTAIFLLSYYAALRAGEVVKSGKADHQLKLENVQVKEGD